LLFAIASKPATEWSASVWVKRRAFNRDVEKIAELVSEKDRRANSTINVSYGRFCPRTLTKPLMVFSIGAFENGSILRGATHAIRTARITRALELAISSAFRNLEEEVAVFPCPF